MVASWHDQDNLVTWLNLILVWTKREYKLKKKKFSKPQSFAWNFGLNVLILLSELWRSSYTRGHSLGTWSRDNYSPVTCQLCTRGQTCNMWHDIQLVWILASWSGDQNVLNFQCRIVCSALVNCPRYNKEKKSVPVHQLVDCPCNMPRGVERCLSYVHLFGTNNTVLVPLTIFSLKRSATGALGVRYWADINMAGDNVFI